MKLWKYNAFLIIFSLIIYSNSVACKNNTNHTIFIQSNSKRTKSKSNSVSAVKTESTNKIKYIVKVKPNKQLDKKDAKKNTSYKECKKKTGILNFVVKHPKKGKTTITVVPAFVILNKESFSVFKSVNKNLLESVRLDSIQRITHHYIGTNCFNIIVNKISNIELNIDPITICASSKKKMDKWINGILEFKHCKLKKITDHPGKVIVDFTKINTVSTKFNSLSHKLNSENTKNISNDPLNGLYYNNTNRAYIKSPQVQEETTQIHDTVHSIVTTIKKGNIAHNRIKRQFKGKLKTAKKFTQHVLKKEEKIKEMLRNHVELQKEREDQLIKIRQQTKEMKILKETEKKLKKLKEEEIARSKAEYNAKIQAEKEKANRRTKKMIKTIMEQDKLRDFGLCLSHKLFNFTNSKFILYVCSKYYGESSYGECIQKDRFCEMCCDHNIGINHVEKKFSCKKKCGKIINGEARGLDDEPEKTKKKK